MSLIDVAERHRCFGAVVFVDRSDVAGVGVRCRWAALLDGSAASEALHIHLEDGRVMNEPVDGRDGHRFVGKEAIPSAKWAICGNHDGSLLVSGRDKLEEYAGFGLVFVDIGYVVEDDEIVLVEFVDGAFKSEIAPCALEFLDEIGGPGEENPEAVFDQGRAEGGTKMRLSGARQDRAILPGIWL
jgi:hypothetical protein